VKNSAWGKKSWGPESTISTHPTSVVCRYFDAPYQLSNSFAHLICLTSSSGTAPVGVGVCVGEGMGATLPVGPIIVLTLVRLDMASLALLACLGLGVTHVTP
jgi:hypothetical protein